MLAITSIIVTENSKRKGNFLCSIIGNTLGNMMLSEASKNNSYFLMALTANNLMKIMANSSQSSKLVTQVWKKTLVKNYKSSGWVVQFLLRHPIQQKVSSLILGQGI